MKRFGVGRKIAVGIGIALLAVAGWFFVETRVERHRVDALRDARLVDVAVDFSKLGETVVEFRQTSSLPHFQYLLLEIPGRTVDNASSLVGDLRFGAEIKPHNEAPITLARENTRVADFRGMLELASLHPPACGDYTLTVRVTQGAPALAGVPQRLVMRYELCGLEYFVAILFTYFSVAAAVVGLIVILVACLWRRRTTAAS